MSNQKRSPAWRTGVKGFPHAQYFVNEKRPQDFDHHLFVYLQKELDDGALEVIKRTFGQFRYYVYHYISMSASVEEYVAHRDAYGCTERVVQFFLIYEGKISDYDEICFRVVFDPQPPRCPERIEFVSAESGLKRIALAGLACNRTQEELLAQAQECDDEILR